MIDDAAGIEAADDGLGAERGAGVSSGPFVARGVDAVDEMGVHVFAVAGGVVTHGVHDDGWVILCDADVELSVLGVAVCEIGIGGIPLVMREVRLREGDQHAEVVGGTEDFGKAQVVTRLAAVIVRINEVDAEALEAANAFLCTVVCRPGRTDLSVIERHGGQKMRVPLSRTGRRPRTRESRIAPSQRRAPVHRHRAGTWRLRTGCGVWMSQSFRDASFDECDAAVFEVRDFEQYAAELPT